MASGTNKPLLFLTACVNPKGMTFTAIQSPQIRLEQYLQAVRFYLKETPYEILLIDNSNYDFTPNFEKEVIDGRMEILSFDGNNYDKSLGKGYGEGLIIKYGFEHSQMIQRHETIIKVTGRHIVKNTVPLMRVSKHFNFHSKPFVAANVGLSGGYACSDIFIASKSFYQDFFIDSMSRINDSKKIYFEHVLYQAICQNYKGGEKAQAHLFPPAYIANRVVGFNRRTIRRRQAFMGCKTEAADKILVVCPEYRFHH